MVSLAQTKKVAASSSSDLLSSISIPAKTSAGKSSVKTRNFADIVKKKTKSENKSSKANKEKDSDKTDTKNDDLSNLVSEIMDIVSKAKDTGSTKTDSDEATSDSTSTAQSNDTSSQNPTFAGTLSNLQSSLQNDDHTDSKKAIQDAINSMPGLSDADKKALTGKLDALTSKLQDSDPATLSSKDSKALDSLMDMLSKEKSNNDTDSLSQIKKVIQDISAKTTHSTQSTKQPTVQTTLEQSANRNGLLDAVRGVGSQQESLSSKIQASIKAQSPTKSDDSRTNISGDMSQISSVAASVIKNMSVTNSKNVEAPASSDNTGTLQSISSDNMFSIMVNNSENGSGGSSQNGSQNSNGGLLSKIDTPSIKTDDTSLSSGNFESVLSTMSETKQTGSTDGATVEKATTTSTSTGIQDASAQGQVTSFTAIAQAKNISMTVNTGDNVPVRVKISKSDDGTATLTLQSSDSDTTGSLIKTQDVLTHHLEKSGLQHGTFKIDILPTDTSNSVIDQSFQNLGQQSSGGFGGAFSGNNENNAHHMIGQYEVNAGNTENDDIILPQDTKNASNMSYNGGYGSLNISV